jgi:hypothetical protein
MAAQRRIVDHMRRTEMHILQAFGENGLYAYRTRGVQGPHTFSYALRLHETTANNLRKAERLGPAVEAAIGDGPVRVYSERGTLWVEVPSPEAVNWPGRALQGQDFAVPLGVGTRRQIVGVDLLQSAHLLVVAPTGAGKTTAMRAIAFHLARQGAPARFIVLTLKPQDWKAFGSLAHTLAVVTEKREVEALLAWLVAEMHERARRGRSDPHVVLFADDLLNWLAVVDVVQPLAEIASLGRAAGIHLVIATQRLGKRGAGDVAVTGNMPTRLILGAASSQDAAQFAGRGNSGAHMLGRYPGDGLLVDNDRTQRLAISPVGDGDLDGLPRNAGFMRPWLDDLATTSAAPAKPAAGPSPAQPVSRQRKAQVSDQEIRAAYDRLGSKNKVSQHLFGYKDGWTWERINQALEASS